jgi:hypothetical protein
MANTIKLKSSVVAGKIPTTSDISKGEVAVNFADAKIFGRHPSTDAILELGGGGGGGGGMVTTSYLVKSAFAAPYNYIGRAALGTAEGDATWDITRIEVASDGSTTVLNATGAWTNRASLSYT